MDMLICLINHWYVSITPQRKSYLIGLRPIRAFVAQDAPVSRLPVADNRNSWAVLNTGGIKFIYGLFVLSGS